MQKVRFIKEPGYLFDLYFVFLLHFNKEYCLKHFINGNKSAADTEFFKKVSLDYEEISRELLPFFYIINNRKCFMSEFYFNNSNNKMLAGYTLATVLEEISDHEQVVLNLLQYYFPDADRKAIVKSEKRILTITQLIKESDYNDTLKSGLYALLIDPDTVIRKLYYELLKKEVQLSQQYDRKASEIAEIQRQLSVEELSKKWNLCKGTSCDLSEFDDIVISFCFLNKNCLKYEILGDAVLAILGTDYVDCLEFCTMQYKTPELDIIGNALAEKNRVDILELIWEKKEITIKDVEQILKFTGTNAYYHISLMIRANLICSRNQGRTVLYSINGQCFEAIREMLKKYADEGVKK